MDAAIAGALVVSYERIDDAVTDLDFRFDSQEVRILIELILFFNILSVEETA